MRIFLLFFVKLYVAAGFKVKELKVRHRGRPGRQEAAIRKAKRLHKKNGKRYRVFFILGRYRVWTRADIKRVKNQEILKRELKAGEDFDRIAFYDTNLKNV